MAQTYEVNFDGLVGPTHHYAGLSYGNVASLSHKNQVANPKEAALQGLRKMKFLASLGLKQGIIPPQERPNLSALRLLGFDGTPEQILKKAMQEAPEILSAVWSSSSMWTANAATVSPSFDSQDGRVHFTPANLSCKFHRSIEADTTGKILKAIFRDPSTFAHHSPLPSSAAFQDEGAANHSRFCKNYGEPGLQFFVYGRTAFQKSKVEPKNFPARQTREASVALARLHRLDPNRVVYAQQNPDAIDAGAFHNDVVAVGNSNVLFFHENAFLDTEEVIASLKKKFHEISSSELKIVQVAESEVKLSDAVKSYLFNSQLIHLNQTSREMALIAPQESQEVDAVRTYLEKLIRDESQPIREVHYFDLKQSMQNGGGPACLRLRVVLTEEEIAKSNLGVYFSDSLYHQLCAWVNRHYRDRLTSQDLVDVSLLREVQIALDELTQILNLGSIYPFQLGS